MLCLFEGSSAEYTRVSSPRLTLLTSGHSEKAHQGMAIESSSPRKKHIIVAVCFWYSDQQRND